LSAVTGAIAPAGHPALYDLLVGLHVLCVVIGFGSVAVSGAYGTLGRHAGTPRARSETTEELRRFFAADSRLSYLLVLGPPIGVAALTVRPGGSELGQFWTLAGLVAWVAASTLLLGVVRPAEAQIRAATAAPERRPDDEVDPPPTATPAIAAAARRLAWSAAACDLIFAVVLVLMVTQPA
jgi:hypothetical protein